MKITIDEFSFGDDYIIEVTNNQGQTIEILLPKDTDFSAGYEAYGLNLVSNGHYQ